MSIEAAIYTLLATNSPSVAGGRVYPNITKQDTAPYVAYQKLSGERYNVLEGPAGQARPRFRFHIFANTYTEAKAEASAIRSKLDGFSGVVGDTTIKSSVLENEVDDFEEESELHHVSLDFFISHTE